MNDDLKFDYGNQGNQNNEQVEPVEQVPLEKESENTPVAENEKEPTQQPISEPVAQPQNQSAQENEGVNNQQPQYQYGQYGQHGNFIPPQYGYIPRQAPPRRKNTNTAATILLIALCFLITLGVALTALGIEGIDIGGLPSNSRPDTSNDTVSSRDDTSSSPSVQVPIDGEDINLIQASRPHNENEKYDESGKYTAQGVAEKVRPSVVGILTFVDEDGYMPFAQGSGIVMTEGGYIITNAHVIEDANGIVVVLDNKKEYVATLIGADYMTDIAVIKIEASKLTPAEFGNSDDVVLGEGVIAIGNPAGLAGTITQGIVSGVDRKIRADDVGYRMNCIQTDAAINPGNSGGALVNMYGQVIGINSSKYIATGYEGIGFAITMNEVKPIVESIILKGFATTGGVRIGIEFYEYSEAYASLAEVMAGLYIVNIDPTCPVAKSGLEIYDTIVEFDGVEVTSLDDVSDILKGKEPGDVLRAKVFRLNNPPEYDSMPSQGKYNDSDGEYLYIDIELAEDAG